MYGIKNAGCLGLEGIVLGFGLVMALTPSLMHMDSFHNIDDINGISVAACKKYLT